jgi:1-acyl-sn-glycerol-3-phosphate acyltransferase
MSAYVVRQGKCLCIFPEGGRSPDGDLLEFKKGIGILALELGIPVVPVFISGTFEAFPRQAHFIKLVKIEVNFGLPIVPSAVDTSCAADKYRTFADELRIRVKALSVMDQSG